MAISAEEFKKIQKNLGFKNRQMAQTLFCSIVLVEKMRSGERSVSARTEKIIKQIMRDKL